jgi:aminomethyltransferase
MGELWVHGPDSAAGLGYALVTEPGALRVGRAHYSMICTPDGGVIDDLIVYRVADERYLVVANASNAEVVADELRQRLAGRDARLDDASERTALVAVQGPRSRDILAPLTDVALDGLRYYAIAAGQVAGRDALVARTGYTGEDGFELFVAADDAVATWEALMSAGAGAGLVPCGLGARDTLRLEAGMALYGNELDRETTPFEAGLGRVVKLDKPGDFVGRDALARARQSEPRKQLVGLTLEGAGIARHGYPVHTGGGAEASGIVTSGTFSPTLGKAIAMAYVPPDAGAPGTMVEVGIRAARVPAEVVPLPFYRRSV